MTKEDGASLPARAATAIPRSPIQTEASCRSHIVVSTDSPSRISRLRFAARATPSLPAVSASAVRATPGHAFEPKFDGNLCHFPQKAGHPVKSPVTPGRADLRQLQRKIVQQVAQRGSALFISHSGQDVAQLHRVEA